MPIRYTQQVRNSVDWEQEILRMNQNGYLLLLVVRWYVRNRNSRDGPWVFISIRSDLGQIKKLGLKSMDYIYKSEWLMKLWTSSGKLGPWGLRMSALVWKQRLCPSMSPLKKIIDCNVREFSDRRMSPFHFWSKKSDWSKKWCSARLI